MADDGLVFVTTFEQWQWFQGFDAETWVIFNLIPDPQNSLSCVLHIHRLTLFLSSFFTFDK